MNPVCEIKVMHALLPPPSKLVYAVIVLVFVAVVVVVFAVGVREQQMSEFSNGGRLNPRMTIKTVPQAVEKLPVQIQCITPLPRYSRYRIVPNLRPGAPFKLQ